MSTQPNDNLRGIQTTRSGLVIEWGGYPYLIPRDELRDHRAILATAANLARKTWMDRHRLRIFIETACRVQSLELWR